MFEGIAEIAARVSDLRSALEPQRAASAAQPSTPGDSQPDFAKLLAQSDAKPTAAPAHRFSVGANGATQLPSSSGSGGGLAGLAGMGALGSGFGLLSGLGGNNSLLGSNADGNSEDNGLQQMIGSIARQQGVNPALAQAVAKSESGFDPHAVSPAGAQGLMQLMPSTFDEYAPSAEAPTGLPAQGSISQGFGPTDYVHEPPSDWNGQHYAHFHTGIDIAASQGTPIRATIGGKIEIRSDPEGFGNLVVVRHGPWDVLYGHTSGQPKDIRTGSVVRPGDIVGYVGSTGNSSGPHVHYEIRYQGQVVDPTPFARAHQQRANAFDPTANAKAGVGYLKDMLTRFKNNVPAALAAYNAGPGAVEKYGGIPPYEETQDYVKKTMQYARELGA